MKTTDEIITEFRDMYCKHDEDEIIHIALGVQQEIEQFIREALERVREKTIEEIQKILENYGWENGNDADMHAANISSLLDKLKTNKLEGGE